MFAVMILDFGLGGTAIQGNWTYGGNLTTVNRLTAAGVMSLEEAARQGPTGRYAATWGFQRVQILPLTAGTPGKYLRVHVSSRSEAISEAAVEELDPTILEDLRDLARKGSS